MDAQARQVGIGHRWPPDVAAGVGDAELAAALGLEHLKGIEAAEGVRLWADEAGIRLILADDHGSKTIAVGWIDGVDPLLGPYASVWSER